MVDSYTRELTADERADLSELAENLPRPGRLLGQYLGIIVVGVLVSIAMVGIILLAMTAGWSEMVIGSVAILPGGIALLSLLLAVMAATSIPRVVMEARRCREEALSLQPDRRALLAAGHVSATRVEAEDVIEIALDDTSLYLFGLTDGTTYYYESDLMERGPWPSACFEIAEGEVDGRLVWEQATGLSDELEPVRFIDEPWCFDGFEGLLHRNEGDDAFVRGVYNEAPAQLLHRLLGDDCTDDVDPA